MANYLLKPVYESIFGTSFRAGHFEDRMRMQKCIYLLQDLGISVGSYNFKWYKHGPYSQRLQNDILSLSTNENISIKYSADAKVAMDSLRNAIFQDNISYTTCQWTECLGSVHYIKDNLLPSSASENEILKELESKKPHLNVHNDNERALYIVNTLFS